MTERLKDIQDGDQIEVGDRPTGTLVLDNLLPGKRLWCVATGTGLAPYLSIIRDPALAPYLPSAAWRSFPSLGHLLHEEAPAEVWAAITEWFPGDALIEMTG